MTVKIARDNCQHLHTISEYNSNYYKLPCLIEGCSHILERYDGADNFLNIELGVFNVNVFERKYYLNTEFNEEYIIVFTYSLNKRNLRT